MERLGELLVAAPLSPGSVRHLIAGRRWVSNQVQLQWVPDRRQRIVDHIYHSLKLRANSGAPRWSRYSDTIPGARCCGQVLADTVRRIQRRAVPY